MNHIDELLDNAIRMCGAKNDSDLAKRLGVRHTAVSNWRHNRAKPDVVTAEKLARMTNANLTHVVGMIEASRAQSAAAKAVWRKIAAAAAVLLAVYTATTPHAVSAANLLHNQTVIGISHLLALLACILLSVDFARNVSQSNGQTALHPTR